MLGVLSHNCVCHRRAKLRLVKRRNHVLPVMGAHLHLDHALPYTTLLWVANCSILNFVLVSINNPYHGGAAVVRRCLCHDVHVLSIL